MKRSARHRQRAQQIHVKLRRLVGALPGASPPFYHEPDERSYTRGTSCLCPIGAFEGWTAVGLAPSAIDRSIERSKRIVVSSRRLLRLLSSKRSSHRIHELHDAHRSRAEPWHDS
jgi:hypothetical protein